MNENNIAIIVAAGQGRRAGGKIPKQFQVIEKKPILVRAIEPFEKAEFINEIILIVADDYVEYTTENIVKKYKLKKVKKILPGGLERFNSVQIGLSAIKKASYVFIHDGARPFLRDDTLEAVYKDVKKARASVLGVPVKYTIKLADEEHLVENTIDRAKLWEIQTPQVFEFELIKDAYKQAQMYHVEGLTDDAMVVERMTNTPVHILEGDYSNIKITTKVDLKIGKVYLKENKK